ncbi:hypothetical protein Cni_G08333 [Canna indica]|uniref:Dof zinc finger protein n=1 Tax=Canna indica TaxID=4628 RepID=A0AAQ3K0Q6_9LILI|nr:hypothetical protein Cni_G08333 [Canna indica]
MSLLRSSIREHGFISPSISCPMRSNSSHNLPCQKIPNASSQSCSTQQPSLPQCVPHWKHSSGPARLRREMLTATSTLALLNPESLQLRFEKRERLRRSGFTYMPMEAGEGRRRPAEGEPAAAAAAEAREKCPRCESRDTKFCYYNNYNMSQPRHFCKSCRRYWTLGGSLRNVPIGGSSRKRLRPSPAPNSAAVALRAGSPLRGLSPLADLVVASNAPAQSVHGSLLPSGALVRLDDPFLSCRGGFGLGLGLGLGCSAGAAEEIGYGLGPALLWPPSLLDETGETWRVGSSGEGDCFTATSQAAAGWPDLAISGPADGGAAAAAREVR